MRHPQCAIILLAVAACASPRDSADAKPTAGSCPGGLQKSDAVPFTRVDLGPAIHDGTGYVRGIRVRTVVRDQRDWPRQWKLIGGSVETPRIEFGTSALVVAASEEFPSGPARVEIEDIRQCKTGGAVAVLLRLHTQDMLNDYGDRSIRAVLVKNTDIGQRPVVFVELPPIVKH